MTARRRELWFTAPGVVELREGAPSRTLAPGQLRARALFSGISQGTELLLFRGEGPTPFDPSLDAPGAPTYPRRYGYAWVGEVVESTSARHAIGAKVFALAPHGDEHCLNAADARLLPPEIPVARAVLAASLETAVNVVWDAGIGLGDDVLVIGGGVVGQLIGHAARLGGAQNVCVIEQNEGRRARAQALGFDAVLVSDPGAPSVADVVIEASGDPAALDFAIAHARAEGLVVVASFYGQRSALVALGSAFHRMRLTLRSSQVSRVPPARASGWSIERRFTFVTHLLGDARLDALLETPVPFADAPALYARLAGGPGCDLQVLFHY